ncbi:MAG: HAD family hydrolase [Candidatus Tectimicrobiota bacterium]
MQHIQAIGFDLFDTLVTVKTLGFEEAIGRLIRSLQSTQLPVDAETFRPLYRQTARSFMDAARQEGKETHNRFWICAALRTVGYTVNPDDPRIAAAVEAYFSAFIDHATPLPGSTEMLAALHGRYRLGLLSNLTHAPAAQRILDKLGLRDYFDVVLVSGELGYRKPHPHVFHALLNQLQASQHRTAFVGDNWEADVQGAHHVGMQPIWLTYGQESPPPPESTTAPPEVPRVATWHALLDLLQMP